MCKKHLASSPYLSAHIPKLLNKGIGVILRLTRGPHVHIRHNICMMEEETNKQTHTKEKMQIKTKTNSE